MKHPRTWYVVADGGRARILQKRATQGDRHEAFDIRQELVSADIHRATHDLGAERPGRVPIGNGNGLDHSRSVEVGRFLGIVNDLAVLTSSRLD